LKEVEEEKIVSPKVKEKQTTLIRLNVHVLDITLRVPIKSSATIEELQDEILRRANKKLNTNAPSQSEETLQQLLMKLYKSVESGTKEEKEAASFARLVVGAINERIEYGETIAPIAKGNPSEEDILAACDDLEDYQRLIVRNTILALRNPGEQLYQLELASVIGKIKQASAKIYVKVQKLSSITCLKSNNSELDIDDRVGDVLDSEATVIAIVNVGNDSSQMSPRDKKRQEEIKKKLMEEEEQRKKKEQEE